MSTLRLEPARVGTLTAREGEGRWYGFDLQLAIYALSLTVVGLLMAFTNSGGDPFQPNSVFGLQFQFSEVAKILLAVVLAHYLAIRAANISSLRTLIGAGFIVAPLLGLVLIQPDLGTSLVFGAIMLGALFFSGASLRWLAVTVLGVVAMVPVAWQFILRDYQKQRLLAFLDPAADPLGSGYQLQQSQITVGSGGLLGRGLTNTLAGQNLPVGSTDFVFAHVGEQLGFLGGSVVLTLFALLIWRVLHVGWRSGDTFTLAFSGGIAGMLLFQMIVNVGMVLGVMPITGIPLPFVTYGGASLLSAALGLGILESLAMRRSRST